MGKLVNPITELTEKHTRAIAALLCSPTIKAAAQKAGVGRQQLYKWLNDPLFKAELRRYQDAAIASVITALAGMAGQCAKALMDVVKDEDASHANKVRAALGWLAQTHKFVELGDLADRVAALEETVNE